MHSKGGGRKVENKKILTRVFFNSLQTWRICRPFVRRCIRRRSRQQYCFESPLASPIAMTQRPIVIPERPLAEAAETAVSLPVSRATSISVSRPTSRAASLPLYMPESRSQTPDGPLMSIITMPSVCIVSVHRIDDDETENGLQNQPPNQTQNSSYEDIELQEVVSGRERTPTPDDGYDCPCKRNPAYRIYCMIHSSQTVKRERTQTPIPR